MRQKLQEILNIVQECPINHQKYIRSLKILYNKTKFEEFLSNVLHYLQGVLQKDYTNSSVKLILDFLAKFIAQLSNPESEKNETDEYVHILLSKVIEVVLKYHKVENHNCRYNACSFISTLLTSIGGTQLDDDLCDLIESAMIDNTKDPKPMVRLQAILALFRLQDPLNPDCPVIQAFLNCLKDPSHIVRKEAVKRIAPNALTLPKLKDRTRDINENVRYAAFVHCGDLGLTHFRIIQRQHILRSGFNEKNRLVKNVFLKHFIPKWLSSVNGEYMTFFSAIRLDSDENDISDTREVTKNLIEVFGKTEPIKGLIDALPLNSEKLIPLDKIDCDLIHYWEILTSYLRKTEEMDEYLDMIIPELTAFCDYIDKIVTEKTKTNMNEIQYMDFENMLFYLLDMADNFDLSDEVGRKALNVLVKKLLCNHWLQRPLLIKIVQIKRKLYTNIVDFLKEINQVIADKRNPIVETPRIDDNQKRLQLSKLKVQLLCLKSDLENAVSDNDFQKAAILQEKIAGASEKLESLQAPGQMDIIRSKETKTDQNTVCWCLDLLTATLAYGDLKDFSPSLIALREEFVKPLLNNKDIEIQWRTFKCIATYCIYNEQFAKEQIKFILSPIISYRLMPNYSKDIVVTAVYAISDLLRLHGPKLFDFDVEYASSQNSARRRLYTQDDEDINDVTNQVSLEILLNIMLDMLDDDVDELRDAALTAYSKLILNGFHVTPTVMTRLILKWYNPATGVSEEALQKRQTKNLKLEVILQQKIGTIISVFPERIQEARSIIAKTIIPVISNIANAPKTSPLVDVDPENVLKFLATIIQSTSNSSDFIQRELVYDIIKEISTNPTAVPTPYFAKLLLYLNLDFSDLVLVNELIAQVEILKNMETLDKISKQRLQKYIGKLQGISSSVNTTAVTHITAETGDCAVYSNTTDNTAISTEEQQQAVLTNCDVEKTNRATEGINSQENIDPSSQHIPSNQPSLTVLLHDCLNKKTVESILVTEIVQNNDSTLDQSVDLATRNNVSESTTKEQKGKQKRKLVASNNSYQENISGYDSNNLSNTDTSSQTKSDTQKKTGKRKRKQVKNAYRASFERESSSSSDTNNKLSHGKNQKSTSQIDKTPVSIQKPKRKRVEEELKSGGILTKKMSVDVNTRELDSNSDETNGDHVLRERESNSEDLSHQKVRKSSRSQQATINSQTSNRHSEKMQNQDKTSTIDLNKTKGKSTKTPIKKVDSKTNSNEIRRGLRTRTPKQNYNAKYGTSIDGFSRTLNSSSLEYIINKSSDISKTKSKTEGVENLKPNRLIHEGIAAERGSKNQKTSSDEAIPIKTKIQKLKRNGGSGITSNKNNVEDSCKTNSPHRKESNTQRVRKANPKLLVESQEAYSKHSRRKSREINSQISSGNSSSQSSATKSEDSKTNKPRRKEINSLKVSKSNPKLSGVSQEAYKYSRRNVLEINSQISSDNNISRTPVLRSRSKNIIIHQNLIIQSKVELSNQFKESRLKTNISKAQLAERLAQQSSVFSGNKNGDRNPQVKRKKRRGKKSRSLSEESIEVMGMPDSNSAQSTNLLDKPGTANSVLRSRRLQTTVVHSDSDSPVRVRKAPRKK